MVQKFRKKPQIIEAVQWTGDNFEQIKEFVGDKVSYFTWTRDRDFYINEEVLSIKSQTYDFIHVNMNNWIIKESDGSLYVLNNDSFTANYELMG
jgi:Fe-S cluster biosynthesis and repair protein YggX